MNFFTFTFLLWACKLLTCQAIMSGEPDNGAHPMVVQVLIMKTLNGTEFPSHACTGTVLSPTLVLTAAHCLDQPATHAYVFFDENLTENPAYPTNRDYQDHLAEMPRGSVHLHPDYVLLPGRNSNIKDLALVEFTKALPYAGPFGQLPSVDALEQINGRDRISALTLVGYGLSDGQHLRSRRNTVQNLVQLHSANLGQDMVTYTGPKGSGTCRGDSGGPAFINTNGESANFIIGAVHVHGTNTECRGLAAGARVDRPDVLDWVRKFM